MHSGTSRLVQLTDQIGLLHSTVQSDRPTMTNSNRLPTPVECVHYTWANYGPRAKSGSQVNLFWPAGTYTNLNSHRELSERPFFPLKIMVGCDFQKKNKPQWYKIGIKNEVKAFYFEDHICTWTVIFKKKKDLHLVLQSACGPRLQQFFQIWPFV